MASAAGLLLWWAGAAGGEWLPAREDYTWEFPGDHWARPRYKTEWWYFTGHLVAEDGRAFGYQFTFFRVGLTSQAAQGSAAWAAKDLVMGHAAVSAFPAPSPAGDQGGRGAGETAPPPRGEHRFSEVLYRASPLLGGFGAFPDPVIAWSRGPAGTDGAWRLSWNGAGFDFEMADDTRGFSFRLSTRPVKPLVYQGLNGYSRKGSRPGAASQYYSFTRMATAGEVTVDGQPCAVTGESWMDKEFGSNQLTEDQTGWDWFSLQLGDGREVMLYILRNQDGTDFRRGTVVAADGTATYLGPGGFDVDVAATWKGPEGDVAYPARWRVVIPAAGVDVEVVPVLADQENRSRLIPGMRYWEGAVAVRKEGVTVGRGYVEMTGYGDSSRPAI